MLLNQTDIDFIYAQLTLPGNDPRNAPLGTVLDPTGIRDVQGIGNNLANPTSGAADQQFERLTNVDGSTAAPTTPPSQLGTSQTPATPPVTTGPIFTPPGLGNPAENTASPVYGVMNGEAYTQRNTNISDETPRIISNLVVDQSPDALNAIGYETAGEQKLAVLDDPSLTPQGRLNPFTGNVNPLPYSTFTTMFGQFFDHGLDFVHKGADGQVTVPLLASDPLYSTSPRALNFMIADRTNTVQVKIGAVSTDSLVQALGLPNETTDSRTPGTLTGSGTVINSGPAGVLMLNGVAIDIAANRTLDQVVSLINAQTQLTGVTASNASGSLQLDAPLNQSVNTVSPYIDLSQSYGSAASHTVFLREYDDNGKITGALVSGVGGGMATWADIKANALKIGITLNDVDVLDIPLVRMLGTSTTGGGAYLDANGDAWLVARHLVTGAVYYVQNSNIGANTVVLNANGSAATVDKTLLANLRLQTVGHAFLDDIAHSAVPGMVDHDRNPNTPMIARTADEDDDAGNEIPRNRYGQAETYDNELLDAHFVAGDGRANENVGLTAIHDVFHAEHNRVLTELKSFLSSVSTSAYTIGNSGNNLISDLGIRENVDLTSSLLGTNVVGTGTVRGGTLVINNTSIVIANGSTLDQVVASINAATGTVQAPGTGVAAVNNAGRLELVNQFYQDIHGNVWTGEMLFQAAKLVTEMEYQHLVFGEFVRKFSPNIAPFAAYDISIDPAITAEFAHAVYRFGHSMLTEEAPLQSIVNATSLTVAADSNAAILVLDGKHNLQAGNKVTLSGVFNGAGGLTAAELNGTFKVLSVTNDNTLVIELASNATDAGTASLAGTKAQLIGDMGLIEAFLNPLAYSKATASEFAVGGSQQVGNGIDIWVVDALRNNLVGLPLDLATLNIVRGRDTGMLSLNGVRAELYAKTNGNASFKPYESWTEFRDNLLHPETLINFVMAYSRDAVLEQFGDPDKELADWNALQRSTDEAEYKAYAEALRAAAELAIQDGAFMTYDQGYNAIDFWLGGLAEKKVPGGMLGSTFDFIFAMQMIELQDGDRFYYLNRLAGTNLLAEIEAQLFSDIVMRNTDAENLYTDIFSVPDATVYMDQATDRVFDFFLDFAADKNRVDVTDILGKAQKVGTAGWVRDTDGGWTFYGNPGDYLDARGVFSPNGKGNASEVIVGNDNATVGDRINGLGGNDTIWAKAGNDTVEGGAGNDFIHGGDDDDVITDSEGDDLIWGDAGNDWINGGAGLDQIFGGAGNDTLYGGTAADVIEGGAGNDLIYGDNGPSSSVGDLSGADVLAGGDGDDTIYGGGGDDIIDGGNGDDVIHGGPGNDIMSGWFGDDLFVMDATDIGFGNAIDGGMGFDTVDYSASQGTVIGGVTVAGVNVNLTLPAPTAVPPDTFINVEGLIGSKYNDTLTGGAAIVNVYVLDANGNPTNRLDLLASTAASVGFKVANEFGDPVVAVVNGVETLVAMDYWIRGGDGNDIITGGEGDDTLEGGAGVDTLAGGFGNDIYRLGSDTNDLIVELADEGVDTIETESTTYSLAPVARANIENLTFVGSGNFNGTGNALNNVITGGNGNDSLDGGTGNDTLIGGDGNDTLTGGAGTDRLVGGIGNDVYNVDNTNDTVVEAAAEGTDQVNASVSYTLGANVENLTLTGNANINGTGNDLANLITGNGGANTLNGGGEADTLNGGGGNDSLIGGAGADVLTGGAGNDRFVYQSAADSGVLAAARDRITDFSRGQDQIDLSAIDANTTAGGNQAFIFIGTGAFTGAGQIRYYYDANLAQTIVEGTTTNANATFSIALDGNLALTLGDFIGVTAPPVNTVNGNNSANTLNGTAGSDVINGNGGNDTLNGLAGNDTLNGGAGNDRLDGGDGDDFLSGGTGNDVLIGGLGNDILNGGSGADVFLFNAALGATNIDLIQDFTTGQNDRIQLENAIFTRLTATGTLNAANFRSGANAVAQDANDFIIYNTSNRGLYYDADGNGGGAMVQFATLATNVTLTNAHFVVI